MDADVVVIGGGFAGLVAGRDLRRAGRSVVVLEARARLGGRSWYREIPGTGVKAEYGASWFFRDAHTALAAEIQRHGLRVTASVPTTRFAWLVDGVLRTGDDVELRIREAAEAGGVLDDAVARLAKAVGSDRGFDDVADLDVPVSTWIAEAKAPPETAAFVNAYTAAMGGGEPHRVSMLGLLIDALEGGYRFDQVLGESGESLADGTSALVDAIAADSGADVRLSSPVVRVRHADGVSIDIAGGGEVRALAAIVALPLHVWVDVAFDPPLPDAKRRAAVSGHAGACTKVVAIVEGVPESFLGLGWPADLQGVVGGHDVPGGRLLTGFSGTRTIRIDDRDAIEGAIGAYLPGARVVASGGHDWVIDPYSKSTWFASAPGWWTEEARARSCLEGRLAFAGSDVAAEGAGWIEGAIRSATDAAAEVVDLLAR